MSGMRWLSAYLWKKAIFIAIAAYLSVLTFLAQDRIGATGFNYESTVVWRIGNALESILIYTGKAFSIQESSIMYLLQPLDGLDVFIGGLLVILLILIAVACYRRNPTVSVGLVWYLLMFLPTIGLVQVGSQRLADRYLGWPLVGFICVVVYGVAKAFRLVSFVSFPVSGEASGIKEDIVSRFATAIRERISFPANPLIEPDIATSRCRIFVALVIAAWTVGLGWQARALLVDWSDDLRLCRNAIDIGGPTGAMSLNASVLAMRRGDRAGARRYLDPIVNTPGAQLNLALLDMIDGEPNRSLRRLNLIRSEPLYRLQVAVISGQALERLGRYRAASRAYTAAMSFLPPKHSFHWNVEQLRVDLPILKAKADAAAAAHNRLVQYFGIVRMEEDSRPSFRLAFWAVSGVGVSNVNVSLDHFKASMVVKMDLKSELWSEPLALRLIRELGARY